MDPTAEDELIKPDLPETIAPILQAEPARVQTAVDLMQESVVGFAYPGESRTLVQLHMFAYAWDHPEADRDDLQKELTRYVGVMTEEEDLETDTDFPSIGVEIEVSEKIFPDPVSGGGKIVIDALREMGLDIDFQENAYSTEIRTFPSHSARVQARIIFELQHLGLVPKDTKFFCSLHINLGFNAANVLPIAGPQRLSDVLTYAYVPAGRIRNRGIVITHQRHRENGLPEVNASIPIKQGVPIMERLEFRTPRVNGRLTYRMLVEMQRIGSLLQNTTQEGRDLTEKFIDAVDDLRREYGLILNAPSHSTDTAAHAVSSAWKVRQHNIQQKKQDPEAPSEPNLIDDARAIMHRFARDAYDLHMRQRQDKKPRMGKGME